MDEGVVWSKGKVSQPITDFSFAWSELEKITEESLVYLSTISVMMNRLIFYFNN